MAVEIDGQRPVSSWIELIKDISSTFHDKLSQIYSNNDDMKTFGELMSISHDGDRVTKLVDGKRVPTDNSYPAARLDALIRNFTFCILIFAFLCRAPLLPLRELPRNLP